jgi:adenylate cyclase
MRRVADPASISKDIVLVEINDTSITDFAPVVGRWPWPRLVQSELIDFLKRGPAKVIAYDVLLTEPSQGSFKLGDSTWTAEESDKAMVDSVHDAGNVIMLADAVNPGVTGKSSSKVTSWHGAPYRLGPTIEERPMVLPPFQALTDAALGLGHNFLALDPDGPARRMAPFIRKGDRYLPSLGVAAALTAMGVRPEEVVLDGPSIRVRDRRIPLVSVHVPEGPGGLAHDQLTMLINYRAPAALENGQRPYKAYEARFLLKSEDQLLNGEKPDLDPSVFKDKIVFVGLTASGLLDIFQTPFGDEGTMPGIQLHASMADSVLSGAFIRPAPGSSRVAAVIIAAVSIGLLAAFLTFWSATGAAAVIMGGWTFFAVSAFRDGLWLNLVQPLTAGGIALFAGTAYQYFVEGREKRRVSKLFGRFVSRDVYSHLMSNPDEVALGGKRRDMTVLFSDIRGFTSVTEKGDPEELVSQLNEYFTHMVDVVFKHQGTLDKFVGDMVMALFSAPLDDPEHAEHAVQAAIDMIRELGELNRKWVGEGKKALDIGVGINSGDMIAGNIGSSAVMSYTVIGDNVNLGSRLESANKEYKTRIIISDATRSRLKGHYAMRPLGDVIVKGKTKPVAIFEIQVPSPLVTHEEVDV